VNDRHFWALERLGFGEDNVAMYGGIADALARVAEDAEASAGSRCE
jgi:hypothetical protein